MGMAINDKVFHTSLSSNGFSCTFEGVEFPEPLWKYMNNCRCILSAYRLKNLAKMNKTRRLFR